MFTEEEGGRGRGREKVGLLACLDALTEQKKKAQSMRAFQKAIQAVISYPECSS